MRSLALVRYLVKIEMRRRSLLWWALPNQVLDRLLATLARLAIAVSSAVALLRIYDTVRESLTAGKLKHYRWTRDATAFNGYVARPYRRPSIDPALADRDDWPDGEGGLVLGYVDSGHAKFPDPWEIGLYRQARYAREVPFGEVLVFAKHCPYCGTRLILGQTENFRYWDRPGGWRYETNECKACGWWTVNHLRFEKGLEDAFYDFSSTYAVMKRFDPVALDTPLSLAREYLARNPHRSARFDPFRFEGLMADCLRDCYGDSEIIQLGGHGDGGVDVKAIRADGEVTLIQVKRREDLLAREGVQTVRELHGVMLRDGVARGMVLSTACDFTRGARAEVARAAQTVRGYKMELLSLADIAELLQVPLGRYCPPWRAHGIGLKDPDPAWATADTPQPWIEREVLSREIAEQLGKYDPKAEQ
jgi:hypothetical protein